MHFLVVVLCAAFPLRSTAITRHLRMENIFENIEILTTDLMYKTRGHHCYALVTDKMYQPILSASLFKAVGQSTYFVILVPDFVDTLAPNPIFLQSLMQAQRSGCQTYLIYLANGTQMERFLQFVDECDVCKQMFSEKDIWSHVEVHIGASKVPYDNYVVSSHVGQKSSTPENSQNCNKMPPPPGIAGLHYTSQDPNRLGAVKK